MDRRLIDRRNVYHHGPTPIVVGPDKTNVGSARNEYARQNRCHAVNGQPQDRAGCSGVEQQLLKCGGSRFAGTSGDQSTANAPYHDDAGPADPKVRRISTSDHHHIGPHRDQLTDNTRSAVGIENNLSVCLGQVQKGSFPGGRFFVDLTLPSPGLPVLEIAFRPGFGEQGFEPVKARR